MDRRRRLAAVVDLRPGGWPRGATGRRVACCPARRVHSPGAAPDWSSHRATEPVARSHLARGGPLGHPAGPSGSRNRLLHSASKP